LETGGAIYRDGAEGEGEILVPTPNRLIQRQIVSAPPLSAERRHQDSNPAETGRLLPNLIAFGRSFYLLV
jgi:hypothetical protein